MASFNEDKLANERIRPNYSCPSQKQEEHLKKLKARIEMWLERAEKLKG